MSSLNTVSPDSAVARLTDSQRRQLESLRASYAMEHMPIDDAGAELGARYLLGELSFDELCAALDQRRQTHS